MQNGIMKMGKGLLAFGAVAIVGANAAASDPSMIATASSTSAMQTSVAHMTEDAYSACHTREAQSRANDRNAHNDLLAITIVRDNGVRDSGQGARIVRNTQVDCRNAFAMNLLKTPSRQSDHAETAPRLIAERAEGSSQDQIIMKRFVRKPEPQAAAPYNNTQKSPRYAKPLQVQHTSRVAKAHRVDTGDTLYGIARKHCTSWQAVAKLNDISNPSNIRYGDVLLLPTDGC